MKPKTICVAKYRLSANISFPSGFWVSQRLKKDKKLNIILVEETKEDFVLSFQLYGKYSSSN